MTGRTDKMWKRMKMRGCCHAIRCLLLVTPLLAMVLVPAASQAQSLQDILGGSGNNVSSDLLRNLQQRLTGQANVPSLQPGAQVQNPTGFSQSGGLLNAPMQAQAMGNRPM
ncbi:MAG TPA: hypothetical protein VHY57_11300 [Rhizomicrobium sp.]|nr:hypothetical protein [Rhizomicrobium sp.]